MIELTAEQMQAIQREADKPTVIVDPLSGLAVPSSKWKFTN